MKSGNEKLKIIFTLLVFAVLLCVMPVAADYPTFHGDYGRTGYVLENGPLTNEVYMHITVDGDVETSPAVHNGNVYFATAKGMDWSNPNPMGVFSVNITTGYINWFTEIGESQSGITIQTGKIFIGSMSGSLYCLDETTGEILWNVSDVSPQVNYWEPGLSSSPLVIDSTVYVVSPGHNRLFGFNIENGNEVFSHDLGTGAKDYTSPTLSKSGNILVLNSTGIIEVTPGGTAVGYIELTESVTTGGTVAAKDDFVYANVNGIFSAVNVTTWTEMWNISTQISTTPAITNDAIYIGHSGGVHAYDPADGSLLAFTHTGISGGTNSYLSPVADDSAIYYALNEYSVHGEVYAVSSLGTELWSYTPQLMPGRTGTPTFYASSPAISDGMLFIGSESGGFYIIGPYGTLGATIEVDATNGGGLGPLPEPEDDQLLFSGTVPIPEGVINISYSDSSEWIGDSSTILGVLDAAEKAGHINFSISSSNYGPSLNAIDGIENLPDWSKWWSTYLNNQSSGGYEDTVQKGDTILLLYGGNMGTLAENIESAEYIVSLTAGGTLLYGDTVTLYEGNITIPYSNGGYWEGNGVNALGALNASGVSFNVSNQGYMNIDDIGGIETAADWSNYWALYINGAYAQVNLEQLEVALGDTITFAYVEYIEGATDEETIASAEYIVRIKVLTPTLFSGTVLLTKPAITVPYSNGGEWSGDGITALGALLASGVSFNVSDQGYMSIDDIGGIETAADWSNYWALYINGVYASLNLEQLPVTPGDVVMFAYVGYIPGATDEETIASAEYLVNITIGTVTLYDGTVTLNESTIQVVPSNNLTAVYNVSGLTDIAALTAAGLSYNLSDSWYWLYEPHSFTLSEIEGISDPDWNKYWGISVNGISAPYGIGANNLTYDDYVTFSYGEFGQIPDYIVNITVASKPTNPGGNTPGGDDTGISYQKINPGTGTFTFTTNYAGAAAKDMTVQKMTAFGVLHAAGASIVAAERWGGLYVDAIDGLSGGHSGTSGWMFQLNGVSSSVMADKLVVKNGDKVIWYFSDNMQSTPETSSKVYRYEVSTAGGSGAFGSGDSGDSALEMVISTVSPAASSKISIALPGGVSISGNKITVDMTKAREEGSVSVDARQISIQMEGILITIPVSNVEWNGDIATATIRSMTIEVIPAPVKVPTAGIAI